MKFSNRLLLFLAGVVFVFLGLLLFTKPSSQPYATAGGLHLYLLVSSYKQLFCAISLHRRASAHLFIFSKGLLVFQLFTSQFWWLDLRSSFRPYCRILVNCRSHYCFLKAIVQIDFPIIGRNITGSLVCIFTRFSDCSIQWLRQASLSFMSLSHFQLLAFHLHY